MKMILVIAYKEFIDAIRDKRTMSMVLISILFGMPMMMIMMSEGAMRSETQQEKKVILVAGIDNAPTLENYIIRQGFKVDKAPNDYEQQLQSKKIIDPVLAIDPEFEKKLALGEHPNATIVFDLANQDSQIGVQPIKALLQGFGNELASMNLMMRGVSIDVLNVLNVQEKHLSRTNDNGAPIKGFLCMMLLMTMASVGLYAAIDTSAGERERGSLEPLVMNPISSLTICVGKWLAVGLLTVIVMSLSVLSIYPSSFLVRNETIKLLTQFSAFELAQLILVLTPLALTYAALQIAFAINGKTHKEGQARATMLIFVSAVVPIITIFKQGADPFWFKWVPILAQNKLMNNILNNEIITAFDIGAPLLSCMFVIALALVYTAHKLRRVLM